MSPIRNEDLVLEVSSHVDPEVWDESRYDAFVDMLCQDREYQRNAIFTALRFLAGGRYQNLRVLAKENYEKNTALAEAYGSWKAMEAKLQLPDLLACSLDLATGTGKSYVLYGIAAILLNEGVVDRALVLCPSNTIEHGLTEKFRDLASDAALRDVMPSRSGKATPRIIDATESLVPGTMCVENYHAVLKHVRSSIRDSVRGAGEKALVLNDEAHHVASASSDQKKWKEFLLDAEFGFRRVVGVSGTCYIKNEYFADVVSRYSLRQAIEDRQVKNVEYLAEGPSLRDPDEKWRFVHGAHRQCNRRVTSRLGSRQALTIIVTKNITGCEAVAEDLRGFLQREEGISAEQADRKVLVVTSSARHAPNVARLRVVDDPQSPVEWIVSVSMLTEGWDVKTVFQIVPHEERAFNSKLLISQVLGRGLRIPEAWTGEQPMVTVLNHHAWAGKIRQLVREVLDVEKRISSVVLPESKYHFRLHHLEYEKRKHTALATPPANFRLFERGFIELPHLPAEEPVQTTYERVRGPERTEEIRIRRKTFTAEEVSAHMHANLAALDAEAAEDDNTRRGTNYTKRYSLGFLRTVVRDSVHRAQIDDRRIPDEVRQKFLRALGSLRRKSSGRVAYQESANALVCLETTARQDQSCSASELRRGKTVALGKEHVDTLKPEQRDFFRELLDMDGEYSGAVMRIDNAYHYKSPVNLTIADSRPERRFIRHLCDAENTQVVDSWIKNASVGFYAIEYSWSKPTSRLRGASHVKRGMFSPDFFLKCGERIIVVEIKDDGEIADPNPENVGKHEFACRHFNRLNEYLRMSDLSERYHFHMLTPIDYLLFFDQLRKRDLGGYKSRLDATIVDKTGVWYAENRFRELDVVRLVTDAYEEKGWQRGKVGVIVDACRTSEIQRYGIEFEDEDDVIESVSAGFLADELELVRRRGRE